MKNNKIELSHASESVEQICLFRWAAYSLNKYPKLELMFHIPNGGRRDKATGAKLKAEGVKAGVPDICLPIPKGPYHGLFIEMKAGKNKPTAEQNKYLKALDHNFYFTAVCYGWEDASKVIELYLNQGGASNEN